MSQKYWALGVVRRTDLLMKLECTFKNKCLNSFLFLGKVFLGCATSTNLKYLDITVV
jgi:hypothetical protein